MIPNFAYSCILVSSTPPTAYKAIPLGNTDPKALNKLGDTEPAGKNLSASAPACKAMKAAAHAEGALVEMNESRAASGEDPVDFGLGLHVGEVTFGNIGVPERLEFSVVGPAANEVARLETLTKRVGRRIVVSADFASLLDLPWESLGHHKLRGVADEVEVLSPPADQSTW